MFAPFHIDFVTIVMGHLHDLGFPTDRILAKLAEYYFGQAYDPDYNIYLTEQYMQPGLKIAESRPALTSGITANQGTIEVSDVPSWWEPPLLVWTGNTDYSGEQIRICRIDGTTLTVCGANGRGAFASSASTHGPGTTLGSFQFYRTWGELRKSYINSNATAFTSYDDQDGYAYYVRAVAATLYPYSALGHTGEEYWETISGLIHRPRDGFTKWAIVPRVKTE